MELQVFPRDLKISSSHFWINPTVLRFFKSPSPSPTVTVRKWWKSDVGSHECSPVWPVWSKAIAAKEALGSLQKIRQRFVCGTLVNLVECVKTFTVFYSVNHKIATCLFFNLFWRVHKQLWQVHDASHETCRSDPRFKTFQSCSCNESPWHEQNWLRHIYIALSDLLNSDVPSLLKCSSISNRTPGKIAINWWIDLFDPPSYQPPHKL